MKKIVITTFFTVILTVIMLFSIDTMSVQPVQSVQAVSLLGNYHETTRDCPDGGSVIRCRHGGEGCDVGSQCFCDEEDCEVED